jgi:hypothetical protein
MKIWEVIHFRSEYDGPEALGYFSSLERAMTAVKAKWPNLSEDDLRKLETEGHRGSIHRGDGLALWINEQTVDDVLDG